MPVCERTYRASNGACSVVAAFENSRQGYDNGMVNGVAKPFQARGGKGGRGLKAFSTHSFLPHLGMAVSDS
jgi:hypothetical protein